MAGKTTKKPEAPDQETPEQESQEQTAPFHVGGGVCN